MNKKKEISISAASDNGTGTPAPLVYSRSEHNISRQKIDPDALKIMYRLLRHGYKAFLVGGGVRDLLLNKQPKDFDIGTDATPRKIKALFRNSRIIGRRFKLVHVFFRGNRNIEVSTFRAQSEPGEDSHDGGSHELGQHDNIYGDESTDALRRDITINGLFYDISSFSVIDYVGGMQDLKDRVIRVIGDPGKRFEEDPVRLLRVVRHAARTSFSIEPACWQSLVSNHHLISKSSAVRVYEELKKDLSCGHLATILKLLSQSGLLNDLLPELAERKDLIFDERHPFFTAVSEIDRQAQSGQPPSATVVLAIMVLLYQLPLSAPTVSLNEDEVGHWIDEAFTVLQVPRKERERIEQLIRAYLDISCGDAEKVKLGYLAKKPYFEDLISLTGILSTCLQNEGAVALIEEAKHYRSRERKQLRESPPPGRGRRRKPGGRHIMGLRRTT
ncbi:MAG: hypothetical protein J5J00_07895 [Deltaproteobacteria bacterium]|nr:hypothetical protein [Deltaproteobacteria bacterium]